MNRRPERLADLLPAVVADLAAQHTTNGAVLMGKFRKKPVVVEARQVVDDPRIVGDIVHWIAKNGGLPAEPFVPSAEHVLSIVTREGEMVAALGDWIIREPHPTNDRKFYPCKQDIFEATYEPVDGGA